MQHREIWNEVDEWEEWMVEFIPCKKGSEFADENDTSLNEEIIKFTEEHKIAAGRFGDPNDVGSIVAVLCSEFSNYITGQSIVIDGGVTNSTF